MQTTDNATSQYESASSRPLGGTEQGAQALAPQATFADYKVIRRNGSVVAFEPSKIAIAVIRTASVARFAYRTAAATHSRRTRHCFMMPIISQR